MMQDLIKIGVTFTGTDEKHSNYVNWLKGSDAVEIITLSPEVTDLKNIKNLDGIVLSGGVDMHPKFYKNNITDYPNKPGLFDEIRDEFELEIFRLSQLNSIPLLGVCRGMQLINCALGGTLLQDNGTIANAIHRFENKDKAHGINIFTGTLLNEITEIERSITNSAHHQSINKLGEGLTVNCLADDGIIEGIEWAIKENKSFFLAVQWHPERMYHFNLQTSPVSKNIRDHFINEIKKAIKI